MLAQLRQARILDEIQRAGGVRVSSLTEILGVSDMTIRRDLEAMARRGLLAKVHGGATAVGTAAAVEPSFENKRVRETAAKQAIAARAAAMVQPGMAIAVTAGTTTWTLAGELVNVPNLTVLTNSLKVADVLNTTGRRDLTVILTGGVRTPSDGLVGPIAVRAIESLHVDLLMMGVHGLDERAGITTPNLLEADTNRSFVAAARRLVVIADHTKWGLVGLSHVADLGQIDTLVTDEQLPDTALQTLRDHDVDVITAHGAPHRTGGTSIP